MSELLKRMKNRNAGQSDKNKGASKSPGTDKTIVLDVKKNNHNKDIVDVKNKENEKRRRPLQRSIKVDEVQNPPAENVIALAPIKKESNTKVLEAPVIKNSMDSKKNATVSNSNQQEKNRNVPSSDEVNKNQNITVQELKKENKPNIDIMADIFASQKESKDMNNNDNRKADKKLEVDIVNIPSEKESKEVSTVNAKKEVDKQVEVDKPVPEINSKDVNKSNDKNEDEVKLENASEKLPEKESIETKSDINADATTTDSTPAPIEHAPVVRRKKAGERRQDFDRRRSFRRSLTENEVFMDFVSTTDLTEFFKEDNKKEDESEKSPEGEPIKEEKVSESTVYKWCIECTALTDGSDHDDHAICTLNEDQDETILALDEMVEHGVVCLSNIEKEIARQRKILKEIKGKREKFLRWYRKRLDTVMKDVKDALEDQGAVIFKQMEEEAVTAQMAIEESISKAPPKLDSAKEFVKKGAMLMPEMDGRVDIGQLRKLKNLFDTLMTRKPQLFIEVHPKFREVKFQNSYKTKLACVDLAKEVMGWIQESDVTGKETEI